MYAYLLPLKLPGHWAKEAWFKSYLFEDPQGQGLLGPIQKEHSWCSPPMAFPFLSIPWAGGHYLWLIITGFMYAGPERILSVVRADREACDVGLTPYKKGNSPFVVGHRVFKSAIRGKCFPCSRAKGHTHNLLRACQDKVHSRKALAVPCNWQVESYYVAPLYKRQHFYSNHPWKCLILCL